MKEPKSVEVQYRKALLEISNRLQALTKEIIVPLLQQLEPQYVRDAVSADLSTALDRLAGLFTDLDRTAQIIATAFVQATNRVNRERFYGGIERSFGVNLSFLVRTENLEDTLIGATRRNVALIKSMPAEYFKEIEQIIFTEVIQGSTSTSIIKQLRDLGSKTDNRARLIARDQTAKLNGQLNWERQTNLGVEEYVWSTSDDERVRPSHKRKDGQVFRWDSPPADTGHPGQDIQCRCVADPIIKL